jgi:hypothetical protein
MAFTKPDFEEWLAEARRFSETNADLSDADKVKLLLTFLGVDGIRQFNDFVDRITGRS